MKTTIQGDAHVALHTIECFTGVGMLGEGLRAGLAHMGRAHRAVCYVEREAFAAAVLAARIEEGSMDDAPIWSDVTTFDGRPWRGRVDCIAGGFPCQDLSVAGRRAGLNDGTRSGLFFDLLRIADDSGAWCLVLENVAGIATATAAVVDEEEGALEERAAARVVGELADRGWHAEWLTLSAADVGASHGRERWFCFAWRAVANTDHDGSEGRGLSAASRRVEHGHLVGPGKDLDDAARLRWSEGWPKSVGQQGRLDVEQSSAPLADAGHGPTRNRNGGASAGPSSRRLAAADSGSGLADTSEPRLPHAEQPGEPGEASTPGRRAAGELRGACLANADSTGQRSGGWPGLDRRRQPTPHAHERDIFAPGPSDDRWRSILADNPWLAPAIDPAAQPIFRRVADGVAGGLDFTGRAGRLKCAGNGVVPAQAGLAFVILARRAGVFD